MEREGDGKKVGQTIIIVDDNFEQSGHVANMLKKIRELEAISGGTTPEAKRIIELEQQLANLTAADQDTRIVSRRIFDKWQNKLKDIRIVVNRLDGLIEHLEAIDEPDEDQENLMKDLRALTTLLTDPPGTNEPMPEVTENGRIARARKLVIDWFSCQKTIHEAGLMDNYTDAARARERQPKIMAELRELLK